MRVAIFGASGKTGRPLVQQALTAGHEVRVLVRDPSKLQTSDERLVVSRAMSWMRRRSRRPLPARTRS